MAAQMRKGVEAIEEGVRERRAGGVQGPGTSSRHVITTVAVSLDSDVEASSTAYWLFFRDTPASRAWPGWAATTTPTGTRVGGEVGPPPITVG